MIQKGSFRKFESKKNLIKKIPNMQKKIESLSENPKK